MAESYSWPEGTCSQDGRGDIELGSLCFDSSCLGIPGADPRPVSCHPAFLGEAAGTQLMALEKVTLPAFSCPGS